MRPIHQPEDKTKLEALKSRMKQFGWQGPPLVKYGDSYITGAHRYAAAKATKTQIPHIEIAAVFREAKMDFGGIWREEKGSPSESWQVTMGYVIPKLPRKIREKYGLDWDGDFEWDVWVPG